MFHHLCLLKPSCHKHSLTFHEEKEVCPTRAENEKRAFKEYQTWWSEKWTTQGWTWRRTMPQRYQSNRSPVRTLRWCLNNKETQAHKWVNKEWIRYKTLSNSLRGRTQWTWAVQAVTFCHRITQIQWLVQGQIRMIRFHHSLRARWILVPSNKVSSTTTNSIPSHR